MKLRALFLCLLFIAFGLRAEDYEARVFTAGEGGGKLPYRLLKPLKYDVNQKYPLVILLHGAGERGEDNTNQLKWGGSLFTKPEVREKFASFVVVPQCPNNKMWVNLDWGGDSGIAPADPGPTQKLLLGMIETVQKEFSIDPDRLYLTGLSMGGFGTWDLITRYPDKFAAAAPICGGGDKTKAGAAKPVPVWAFHGDADNVVKPSRTKDMVEGLKAAGGQAAHTVYAGVGHDSWNSAFSEPNFLPWMFAQRRGQPAQKMELAVSRNSVLAMPQENVFPGAGPLQLADWFKKGWMARRVKFARDAEKDKGAIIFLGDDLTDGWTTLDKDFPGRKTANRGINGDTSRGVRYRLREDVLDLNPKAVCLLIGTNDLALGGTPEQVTDNVKAIIAELQKQNANIPIILHRVLPREPKPGVFPDKSVKLNQLLDALAANDKRLAICDTWTIFDDGKGGAKKEFFRDPEHPVHPNVKGYAKWKESLDAVFAKLKL